VTSRTSETSIGTFWLAGLFTSPHLVSTCERFRINGKPIPDIVCLRHINAMWDGLERRQDQSGPYQPTAYFFRSADEQVDVVLLEVDQTRVLGATLNLIANAKEARRAGLYDSRLRCRCWRSARRTLARRWRLCRRWTDSALTG
jgi:folylpolyglutamate synthase/dihydropteroate synthase